MKLAVLVFLALRAVVAVQVAYYAPLLPDTVASHFNGAGQPDGWMSKTAFLGVYLFIVATSAGIFFAIGALVKRVPDRWINLPRKDHWLAPERREETLEFLSVQMLWFGNVTLMFLSHVMGVAMAANLEPHPRLGESTLWALVLYLAFTVVWTVYFIGRFYRKPG